MVLRQCLACNSTILGTLQICTCGHVFEDVRQIGGKRFSEYRANLYTRLEAKRMKFSEDESNLTQSDSNSADDDREKQVVLKPKKSRPSSPLSSRTRRKKGKRKRGNEKGTHENQHENKTVSLFHSPEEEAERFAQALQEINRRIMGQSLVCYCRTLSTSVKRNR